VESGSAAMARQTPIEYETKRMEGLTFLGLAKRVLEEEKKPLSVDEIWTLAKSKGHDQLLRGQGKTPWATLGAQLHVNVRDRRDAFT
jgi:hypothetical protein